MTEQPSKSPPPYTSWREALPEEGVVQVFGHRRTGKTASVYKLAEDLHKKGWPVTAMYPNSRRIKKLLPPWIKVSTDIASLKRLKGHIIVADEMALQAHAREHASDANRDWAKLMAIVAQFHHLLFLVCQHSRQLDVALVMDADLVIFKEPSLMHIRFARPELRSDVQTAYDAFREVPPTQKGKLKDPRNWAYVTDMHHGRSGFLRTGLPSFWSEELSTVFADMEAEEAGGAGANAPGTRRRKTRLHVVGE